jgi:hypothetical protein
MRPIGDMRPIGEKRGKRGNPTATGHMGKNDKRRPLLSVFAIWPSAVAMSLLSPLSPHPDTAAATGRRGTWGTRGTRTASRHMAKNDKRGPLLPLFAIWPVAVGVPRVPHVPLFPSRGPTRQPRHDRRTRHESRLPHRRRPAPTAAAHGPGQLAHAALPGAGAGPVRAAAAAGRPRLGARLRRRWPGHGLARCRAHGVCNRCRAGPAGALQLDFLTGPPPASTFAAVISNQPFNRIDEFTSRGLDLLRHGSLCICRDQRHRVGVKRCEMLNDRAGLEHSNTVAVPSTNGRVAELVEIGVAASPAG